ncbi:hypothetical protein Hanom_Chr12g01089321 [Helianthus anomalus]
MVEPQPHIKIRFSQLYDPLYGIRVSKNSWSKVGMMEVDLVIGFMMVLVIKINNCMF